MHDHVLDLVLPQPALEALAERVAGIIGTSTEGYLGAEAAAEFLGISRRALYALVERDRGLPYYRPAGRLLFRRSELRAWVRGERLVAFTADQSQRPDDQSPGAADTARGVTNRREL